MSIDKAVKVNGAKFFSFQRADGWSDPFAKQAIFSRTLLPEGTKVIQSDTEEGMVTELKRTANRNIKFKVENLSEDSQVKFVDHKIETRIEVKAIDEVKSINIK